MADVKITVIGEDKASQVLAGIDREFEKISGSTDKLGNAMFGKEFAAGLERGSTGVQNFRSELMQAAQAAGLNAAQLSALAGSTGMFTDREMAAAKAAAAMAAKSQELAAAVKRGEISADQAGREYGEFARSLDLVQKEAGEASDAVKGVGGGSSMQFTELMSKVNLVTGALRTMQQAAETAFQWGKEGAAVAQTTASFEVFLKTVGAAPNLLEQLRAASKGTVDDVTLMASAMNTAAGASEETARRLLEASPQLLEIAKAANKLNPTLGDTTYMFESLTAGIKRQSPLLIDNTGLRLKLGEANEAMARSLGKSVEELTAAEQQQALLNATLEAGNRLLGQVGGNTDSATDAYAQLETAIKQAGDEFKMSLEPAVRGVANALTELLTGYEKLTKSTQAQIDAIDTSSAGWDEYYAQVERIIEAQKGFYVSQEDGVIKVMKRSGQTARDVSADFSLLTKYTLETRDAQAGSRFAVRDLTAEIAAAGPTAEETAKKLEEFQAAIDKMAASALSAGLSGKLSQGWEDYGDKVAALKDKNAALKDEMQKLIAEGIGPTDSRMRDLTAQYNANAAEAEKLREATNRTTREFIYQQAAQNMSAAAQLTLAKSLGLIEQADYDLAQAINNLNIQFDKNADGVLDTGEATKDYQDALQLLVNTTRVAESGMQPLTDAMRDQEIAAAQAAAETRRLADVQAALEAGMAGRLQDAMTTYQQTVKDAATANADLVRQYRELQLAGGDNTKMLADLGAQIDENNRKQLEALDAMKKSTAELIYQQAAQGLSSDAALVLARGLGLVSEADYNLIVQLQALQAQFDANHDGMVSAAEGADAYTAAVLRLYDAQVKLMSVLPNGEGVGGNGYQGNGIYVGGPGETIGPGAMPSAVTTAGGPYGAGGGTTITNNLYNNGLTMGNEAYLQQLFAPIVGNILAGR